METNYSISARIRRRNKQGFEGLGNHNKPIVPEGGYGDHTRYCGVQRKKGKNRKGQIIDIPTPQEMLYREATRNGVYGRHIGSKPLGKVRKSVARAGRSLGNLSS